ncbi:phosphoenolpyruvate carboxylase [Virgibacillus halodenitrificans]|uniref:Phosphoenolpyruvate carboxylase n=1 Tax=Virgibacillus halodenitrificans TaxID=1482 RepID=A0ABR7VKD7_VIRHA|nr:phosphoenolpyruvate carboxylase [Virgibacillus halodenitrificans]MBD1222389.1 phosphoenolpyruvate carboxylase [Virgibacillus halodenitrificans]
MTVTTDSNALLRRDVNMLGSILGEILVLHGGKELFDKVETIREMTKSIRKTYDADTYQTLKNEISTLQPPMRQQVIRAFSIYFHLINIAEQNHRIRRRREYLLKEEESQSFSLEKTVSNVKNYDLTNEDIQDVLNELSVELIMTAHPTEATKRTVLEIQKRISEILRKLDNPQTTKNERAYVEESLFNEVTALWHTDELRHRKPEVLDEVKNGLYYFDQTLFHTLPDVFQDLEMQLQSQISEEDWKVPNFIQFGSWIGGDRDGNPNVTPEITWKTLGMQRELILKKYDSTIVDLMRRFSQSSERITINTQFIEKVEEEEGTYLVDKEKWPVKSEVYRRKFAIILKRLRETGKTENGYQFSEELANDLIEIKEHAEAHLPKPKKLKTLRKAIRQVQMFGFHLATLDVRNHSGEHEAAIHEILKAVHVADDYSNLTEEEKQKILLEVLNDQRPLLLFDGSYSEATQKMLRVFRMIKKAHEEFGKRAIEVYLISMTEAPSDLLEVMVLAKEAGIYRLYPDGSVESDIDVAPLLETIDDLIAGPKIMQTLFDTDVYRKQLQSRNRRQEIMLGYSDGSKDGGTLSANWRLFKAQLEIHNTAREYDIRLKFFHGRGGSLGRGGGSLNTSILSQPMETLGDGVKITEQGEVLSSRYLLEDIAYRNLEQAAAALFEACAKVSSSSDQVELRQKEWEDAMEAISEKSLRKYQSLVFGDPDFLTYFNQATPLTELGALNIGSRPMSRKNSQRFEDLRAIPWVFAWTQSRHMLPAWYAAGTGLQSFIEEDGSNLEILQTMYKEWSFFHSTINNLQMALMKADMKTAKEYLELVEDPVLANRIYEDIAEEYERTKKALLQISGNEELLSHTSNIKESVHLRNPYVDPLNFLQVDLIQKLRETSNPSEELVTEVLLTINGVAAGLVNTG